MQKISIKCVGENVVFTNIPEIYSGDIESVGLSVEFDGSWNGYAKVAVFYDTTGNPIFKILDANNECIVPREALAKDGKIYIGVFGSDGTRVITSQLVKLKIGKGATTLEVVPDPTPDIWEQILSNYNEVMTKVNQEIAERKLEINYLNVLLLGADNTGVDDCSDIIQNALANGVKLFFPKGTYLFNKSIVLRDLYNVDITGNGKNWYGGSILKNTSGEALFKIYGCKILKMKDFLIYGTAESTGIEFADDTLTSEACRSLTTYVENVSIHTCKYGILIDCPSGYNYFDYVSISYISEGGEGICIGKNYANTTRIKPNYLYFAHCNIEGNSSPGAFSAFSVYCGQWIYLRENDFCNFTNGYGIYVTSDYGISDHILITNNSLFNNKDAITVKLYDKIVKNVLIDNNMILLANTTGANGIVVENSNSRTMQGLTLGRNTFDSRADKTNIGKFIKLPKIDFANIEAPFEPVYGFEPFCNFVEFDSTWLNDTSFRLKGYRKWRMTNTVPANSSAIFSLGEAKGYLSCENTSYRVNNIFGNSDGLTSTVSYNIDTNVKTITVNNSNSTNRTVLVEFI